MPPLASTRSHLPQPQRVLLGIFFGAFAILLILALVLYYMGAYGDRLTPAERRALLRETSAPVTSDAPAGDEREALLSDTTAPNF